MKITFRNRDLTPSEFERAIKRVEQSYKKMKDELEEYKKISVALVDGKKLSPSQKKSVSHAVCPYDGNKHNFKKVGVDSCFPQVAMLGTWWCPKCGITESCSGMLSHTEIPLILEKAKVAGRKKGEE